MVIAVLPLALGRRNFGAAFREMLHGHSSGLLNGYCLLLFCLIVRNNRFNCADLESVEFCSFEEFSLAD